MPKPPWKKTSAALAFRDDPLRRIDRMREWVNAEIARDFRPDRQAEALGLVAQALLMEVRHRSGTDYARAWLDVMHAIFDGRLDDAAHATARLADLAPPPATLH